MTSKELFPEYKELFISVVESEGQKNGNKAYQGVKRILETTENKRIIDKSIEDDIPFCIFITILVFILLKNIHTMEELMGMESDNLNSLITSIFGMHLKKATREFTSRYGLPPIHSLDTYVIAKKIKNDEEF